MKGEFSFKKEFAKHKSKDIGCVMGKLNAINLILKDAGANTYQTLAKRAFA